MKKIKILSIVLALLVGASALTGCVNNGGPNNYTGGNIAGKNESNATVIKVHNYDCGYGRGYIEQTTKAFAELVKDVPYEEGKTGVFFEFLHTQTNSTGTWLLDSLKNNEYDVFFTNTLDPSLVKTTYSAYVRDVKDLVTMKSTDEGANRFAEEKSIMERMYSDWANFYQEPNGSLYVLPLFSSVALPTYDVALCEDKGLYIAEGSTDTEIFMTNDKQEGCLGVDGVKGTEDDGLPETYAQFYLWCDYMSTNGVTPMIWSGQFPGMNNNAWQQLWVDFEGYEQAKASYTFDGKTVLKNLINVSDSGVVTELDDVAITPENGYMAMKQKGRYLNAQFLRKINDNRGKWVDDRSYSPAVSHTMAQDYYISSTYTRKPIMMLGEWCYWEAEATGTFNDYAGRKGGKTDRTFATLPIPKADRSLIGTGATLKVGTGGTMFLKNGIDENRLQAVEDFYMYFNSSAAMGVQNKEGAQPRPFEYEITKEVSDTMSHFAKDVYRILHSEGIDLVYANDRNDFTTANYDYIAGEWGISSKYNKNSDVTDIYPLKVMKDYDVTAEAWFNGLYDKWTYKAGTSKSLWEQMVSRISK